MTRRTSPMDERPLLDRRRGEVLRERAIRRVERNADAVWKEDAYKAAVAVARKNETFTTDEIWSLLGGVGDGTHEGRAMGAVMRRVASTGVAQATGEIRLSERPECHRRPLRVWRSRTRA